MRIVLAGASGMLGTAVTCALRASGDNEVTRLVRRRPVGPGEAWWNPADGQLDPGILEGADAVINFSGSRVLDPPQRWTAHYRQLLYSSRMGPTTTLVRAMGALAEPPKLFLSQSGSNYYGTGGPFTESSPAGSGFLADLCQAWERAAYAAPTRVLTMRTGVVLGPHGGAVSALLTPLRWGLGGRLGSGAQHWPWISERDLVAAVLFLLAESSLEGPVNFCAPAQDTVNDILRALATALHRPLWLPIPARLLTLALGEAAKEVLLTDSRVVPQVLIDAGFTFTDTSIQSAAQWLVH